MRDADTFELRDVERTGYRLPGDAPGTALDQPVVGRGRIPHAKRHRAYARPMSAREVLRKGTRLGVEYEVDAALLVERDVLVAMARDALKAQALEERAERLRIARRIFDEFESVGLDRVVPRVLRSLGHGASGA